MEQSLAEEQRQGLITCMHATHCRWASLAACPTSCCDDVLRGQAGPWTRVRAVHAPQVLFPKAICLQEAAVNRCPAALQGSKTGLAQLRNRRQASVLVLCPGTNCFVSVT